MVSSGTTQWDQIRQEMDSLSSRIDAQESLQSRILQLENECQELKQRCHTLACSNRSILRKQSEDKEKISDLQRRFDALDEFAKISEFKSKYLEVVVKNQRWEFPLDEHFIEREVRSQGWDDETVDEISYFLIHMRLTVKDMRLGTSLDGIVDFSPRVQHFIEYHQLMKFHWQQFADALDEYQHTINYMEDKYFCLRITDVELPRYVIDRLESALRHTHFHTIRFRNNLRGENGVNLVVSCIKSNPRLLELYWDQNRFESSEDIDRICEAISSHGSIKKISLTACNHDGILNALFAKLKSSTLKEIDLSDNMISNLSRTCISEFLSSNPSLTSLRLSTFPAGDQYIHLFSEQDVICIADALKHNTTLQKLCLYNCLESEHWHLLASVAFDGETLNRVSDSNHHCDIDTSFTVGYRALNPYQDPKLNRRMKIYYLLSCRNQRCENVRCFDSEGIHIKLLPNILALLKPYSEHHLCEERIYYDEDDEEEDLYRIKVEPLSIAYEILRQWKMPLLYGLDKLAASGEEFKC